MPKVSVLIPVYNAAPFLEASINSILQQTYRDFELILLNDASTDNSEQIVQKFYLVYHIVTNLLDPFLFS